MSSSHTSLREIAEEAWGMSAGLATVERLYFPCCIGRASPEFACIYDHGGPLKTVLLLRHAKSSWDDPLLSDHQRPLAPRGQKAAPRMGAYMARESLIPDRVLCSSATRATETWHLVEREMGGGIEVEIRGDLYHASSSSLLALIQELSDKEESVLLVGHNPTFESLAIFLAGSGESRALSEIRHKYPTGALAILDFPTNRWKEVRAGTGHLRDFIKPRTLKA